MKEILEALLLGVVQGLTEFLPVSSSGHLELGKWLLGDTDLDGRESLLFTVLVHGATALATIWVFREDIGRLIAQLFDRKDPGGRFFAIKIILSMIPAVVVGLSLESEIESLFSGRIVLVGFCLLCTGMLLFWADRPYTHQGSISFRDAIWMGIAQAIAILPGISRSGATIGTALLLKKNRSEAARFSFLMVVPLILGKMAKDVLDGAFTAPGAMQGLPMAVGFVAAFVTGVLACRWMINIVKGQRLRYFGYYCLTVGSLAILAKLLW
jgi:undecaprenyl-diphosphatase